jgi:hypothetical protein
LFVQLLRARPDLAATVAKLVEDHEMIAGIASRVRALADQAADQAADSDADGVEAIAREMDGLTAIMESHFRYEERAISRALDDGVADTGWSEMVFRFGPPS